MTLRMASRVWKFSLTFGLLLTAGCGSFFADLGFGNRRSEDRTSPEATPVMVEAPPQETPPANADLDHGIAQADHERIKKYLDRYPQDDLSRKVEGPSEAGRPKPSVKRKQRLSSGAPQATPTAASTPQAPVPIVPKEPDGAAHKPAEIVTASAKKPSANPSASPARQATPTPKPVAKSASSSTQTASANPPALPEAQSKSNQSKTKRATQPNKPVTLTIRSEKTAAADARKDAQKAVGKSNLTKPVLKAARIGEATPPAPAETASPIQTNNAIATAVPPREQQTLTDLIADLEKKVVEQPNDLANQFKLRLLQIADGQSDKATTVVDGMNQELAEILTKLFTLINTARAAAEDPVTGADDALESLDDLRRIVRNYAQLRIPKALLCTRVDSFGVYQEFENPAFLSGVEGQQIIVYSEVKNFAAQKTGDGFYKTVLSQRLEILTPNSHSEWSVEEPKIVDVSRNAREDFFLTQLIELPASLQPGQYYLKVTIEDLLSNRQQEEVIEFSVRASQVARTGDEEG